MYPVIKPDGTNVQPPQQTGRGRRAKYPWRFLEIGDSFVAPNDDLKTLRVMISTGSMFGREHEILRGTTPGTTIIKRTT